MEDVKIKIKKLAESARIPTRATDGAVAYDVVVPKDTIIIPGRQVISLDFAIELPDKNYEAKIEPRSGFSSKGIEGYLVRHLAKESYSCIQPEYTVDEIREMLRQDKDKETVVSLKSSRFNADVLVGKIDSDYRGNVGVIVISREPEEFLVKAGTRIAQMTIYRVPSTCFEEVRELSETSRNSGGFGHTGSK